LGATTGAVGLESEPGHHLVDVVVRNADLIEATLDERDPDRDQNLTKKTVTTRARFQGPGWPRVVRWGLPGAITRLQKGRLRGAFTAV
jgi:hypothetical protein